MIASLNFTQHLLNVRGRKRILRAPPKRLQLRFRVMGWPARTYLAQCSSDPFPHGHTLTLREPLEVGHFLIGKKDLEPFAHTMSIAYSFTEQLRLHHL